MRSLSRRASMRPPLSVTATNGARVASSAGKPRRAFLLILASLMMSPARACPRKRVFRLTEPLPQMPSLLTAHSRGDTSWHRPRRVSPWESTYLMTRSLYGYFLFASSAICFILAPKSPWAESTFSFDAEPALTHLSRSAVGTT